jgi:predicted methyltransferase
MMRFTRGFHRCLSVLLVAAMWLAQPVAADPGLQQRLYNAINAPDRAQEDIFLDEGRRPTQILEFLGVSEGMTALDLMAGSGYYTELLSAAVGVNGKVYAQNDVMALRMRYGAIHKAINQRLSNNRLPNTRLWIKRINELDMVELADIATLMLNMHDLYIYGGEPAVLSALASIMQALKPGGILGVEDHIGNPGNNNQLHRIDPLIAEQLLVRAGFIIVDKSTLLSNPVDDHTLHVFDPMIRGNTDRFVIKAMKPR